MAAGRVWLRLSPCELEGQVARISRQLPLLVLSVPMLLYASMVWTYPLPLDVGVAQFLASPLWCRWLLSAVAFWGVLSTVSVSVVLFLGVLKEGGVVVALPLWLFPPLLAAGTTSAVALPVVEVTEAGLLLEALRLGPLRLSITLLPGLVLLVRVGAVAELLGPTWV